jgi:dGTPase
MSRPGLAAYAADESTSRGRIYAEPAPTERGEYQRDRDRIIHSTAFRRLMYKTQVFVNHEGDLYRTRLTHSLEVAQIGRTVAVALRLNEPLTEAICLAHDLGHTPFGHAGQDALNACMRDFGGFEHNLQSLRVVDLLESRYADFPGLNLMFETREGILKHCSRRNAAALGELGRRFLERQQPGLEAQVADIADAIAYNHHDVDDGLRAGLISLRQLARQPLFGDHYRIVRERYPQLATGDRRLVYETIRRMIGAVVSDLIANSRSNLEARAPRSIDDVRTAGQPLIAMSDDMHARHLALKKFLNRHLYRHEKKLAMTARVQAVLRTLFNCYMDDNSLMPEDFSVAAEGQDDAGRARIVADYIAGMTDRYALEAHARIAGYEAAPAAPRRSTKPARRP